MKRNGNRRGGFTLLEALLATVISLLLLGGLYVVVDLQVNSTQNSRDAISQATLARALMDRISRDMLSSITIKDPGPFRSGQLSYPTDDSSTTTDDSATDPAATDPSTTPSSGSGMAAGGLGAGGAAGGGSGSKTGTSGSKTGTTGGTGSKTGTTGGTGSKTGATGGTGSKTGATGGTGSKTGATGGTGSKTGTTGGTGSKTGTTGGTGAKTGATGGTGSKTGATGGTGSKTGGMASKTGATGAGMTSGAKAGASGAGASSASKTGSSSSGSSGGTGSGSGSASGSGSTDDASATATTQGQKMMFIPGVVGYSDQVTTYQSVPLPNISAATTTPSGQASAAGLRRISYWVVGQGDQSEGLARWQADAVSTPEAVDPQSLPGDASEWIIAREVRSMKISYSDGSSGYWTDSWDSRTLSSDSSTPQGPPRAIKIELEMLGADGKTIRNYSQVVAIPVGNTVPLLETVGSAGN